MKNILVMEQDNSRASRIRSFLEVDDFSVVICSSLDSASDRMSLSKYFAAVFDIENTEIMLEDINRMINQNNIPAVILTSVDFSSGMEEALADSAILDFINMEKENSLEILYQFLERLRLNSLIKVMLVEDSSSTRKLGIALLNLYRFQVCEARDGLEAIGIMEENRDIKIVITDFEMPGMNGYELVRFIRERYDKNTLSIIGISHPSTAASTARFLKFGANDFISKPFKSSEFYSRVVTQVELLESFSVVKTLNDQKNRIFRMVAHDIRSPLGYIEILCRKILEQKKEPLPVKAGKGLEAIIGSVSGMMTLLNDLLNFSSLENREIGLNIADELLDKLVEDRLESLFYSMAEKKKISLVMKTNHIPDVPFDRIRIQQVVDNLISNAIKFTPISGEIIIKVRKKPDSVMFRIWDNGPGLTFEDKGKLFGEFQRLSARPTGGEPSVGLGLAICRKIVHLHNGRIWVESEEGKGAEFCFSLPLE